MARAIPVLLVLVGLVNLYPAVGVVSGAKLHQLYGISIEDPNLLILMRHRAVLFALLGGLIFYSAFRPPLRPVACVLGLASMLSFVLLAWLAGETNAALRRVVVADVVASILLLAASRR
jgi:hypothetical protein